MRLNYKNVLVALTSSARLGFKDNQRRMCGGIKCYNYITGEAGSFVMDWAKVKNCNAFALQFFAKKNKFLNLLHIQADIQWM